MVISGKGSTLDFYTALEIIKNKMGQTHEKELQSGGSGGEGSGCPPTIGGEAEDRPDTGRVVRLDVTDLQTD